MTNEEFKKVEFVKKKFELKFDIIKIYNFIKKKIFKKGDYNE